MLSSGSSPKGPRARRSHSALPKLSAPVPPSAQEGKVTVGKGTSHHRSTLSMHHHQSHHQSFNRNRSSIAHGSSQVPGFALTPETTMTELSKKISKLKDHGPLSHTLSHARRDGHGEKDTLARENNDQKNAIWEAVRERKRAAARSRYGEAWTEPRTTS